MDLPPGIIPLLMNKLRNGGTAKYSTLLDTLLTEISESEAITTLQIAMKYGIIVMPNNSKGKTGPYTMSQNIDKLENIVRNDPYCLECHNSVTTSGKVEKCLLCKRSFHIECQRKNPRKPIYEVPSSREQLHQLPVSESDSDEGENNECVPSADTSSICYNTSQREASLDLDLNSNVTSQNNIKYEPDNWDDVQFVSEQPPLRRKRLNSSVKNEEPHDPQSEGLDELQTCTVCRLDTCADLLNPPHISKEELSTLLRYTWTTHRSWVKVDIRKYMLKYWSASDSNIVKNILFMNNILGVSDVDAKIRNCEFKKLSEFLGYLIDFQHNICLFFGPNSEEYTSTKWLIRDITHDLREIGLCSDCYRYSQETPKSKYSFVKPCKQRHEVVYAKHKGYRPWPAKVIRVLGKRNLIYDVRFFHRLHKRALVPARGVQTDIPDSEIRWQRNKSHMTELRNYMLLRTSDYEKYFSFNAGLHVAEEYIKRVLNASLEPDEINAAIKRSSTSVDKCRSKCKAPATPIVKERVQPIRRRSMGLRYNDVSMESPSNVSDQAENESSTHIPKDYYEVLSKTKSQSQQLTQLKAEVVALKAELLDAKRKRWCQQCLSLAKFDCCFNASYCSAICKRLDRRRHQTECHL